MPTPCKNKISLHFLHTSGSLVRCGILVMEYDEASIKIVYTMSSGKDKTLLMCPSLSSLDPIFLHVAT